MLVASPTRAADRPTATTSTISSTLLTPPAARAKVSSVRVDPQSGRLIRIVSGGNSNISVKAAPAEVKKLVAASARTHGVDPVLVESVIQVESGFDKTAISAKGAQGLMQLMPGTARDLGVANSFDPAQNVEAGVRYLKYLQDLYHDDRLALAAYNAGPKAVERYKKVPPYAETEEYVNRVGTRYRAAKQAEAREASAPSGIEKQLGLPEAPQVEPSSKLEQFGKIVQFIDENGRLHLKTVLE